MTHTPGPWNIGLPGGPAGPFWSLVNPQGMVVAMQITSEANARLIAAAPEMLRALKLSEKYLAKAVELGMMYDCVRSPRSVLDKVQAIIAATEGTDDQG